MLRTRLWVGSALAVAAAGLIVIDQQLGPWHPFLFALLVGLSWVACRELHNLLENSRRPPSWLCHAGVALLIAANWPAHLPGLDDVEPEPWLWLGAALVVVAMGGFLVEMAAYREPGGSVSHMALALWIAVYLGLLPGFLAQLRWLNPADPLHGTTALALTIFVPKVGDIGAYFTGRALGKTPLTPRLSPKKTVEGAVGGLAAAMAVAVAIDRLAPVHVLGESLALEIGFGFTVGLAGMLGDLAESLIKRDCGHKDASQVVPGFGGILDVVDAVIFAGPVAYVWLAHR
jgi:phosphatidate cytidylyltransferase